MKETAETKETAKDKALYDFADKALKNYEQIVKTGLKLQEEAGRCWTNFYTQTASFQDFRKPMSRFAGVTTGVLPEAQKNLQSVLDLMEKNTKTGVELMKKAADAAQTPVIAESQSKWMDFWTASVGAARANTEALMQIHGRAVDSWIDYVHKNTEVTQIRVPKAA